MRRLFYCVVGSAPVLSIFLGPLAYGGPPSAGKPGQPTGDKPVSIVRLEDDVVVEWLCPGFQKTSLLILNGQKEWEAMESAYTVDPETQYYCLSRDLRKGFFRTASEELQEFPRLRIMMPTSCISGLPTPIRVEVLRPDGSVDWEVWEGDVSLNLDGEPLRSPLALHNGIASTLLPAMAPPGGVLTVCYGGECADKLVEVIPRDAVLTVVGELSDPLTIWTPGDGVIRVTHDVTLPAGNTLRIYPDTTILLDPWQSITVNGTIESLGTVEHPVVFAAADPDNPWGQIHHDHPSTKSTYRGTFFIRGGDSAGGGHTDRGPVIRFDQAEIEFDHCNFMDNYGKGLYGSGGDLTFTHCLFSRCAMGMEVVNVDIMVDRCYFLEMPMGGEIADNDPIYLHGQGNMSVTNSIFAIGGDDGIDILSSTPTIENCVVHGFVDKGVSVYYGTTRIKNCLIFSNDYGISAKGDGTNVYVDKTTVAGNRVSVQSRNKYGVPEAVIKYFVTNSILWDHDQAIQTDYPIEDISITYCDVQGAQPFAGDGNINIDPLFLDPAANDYRLQEKSPCRGAGQNGEDMGYVYPDLP